MLALLVERRQQILCVAARHRARNVRVFGSVARDEHRPDSDVDFLVDMDAGRSLLDLIGLEQDLEQLLGQKVHALTEPGLRPYLRQSVVSEAILV